MVVVMNQRVPWAAGVVVVGIALGGLRIGKRRFERRSDLLPHDLAEILAHDDSVGYLSTTGEHTNNGGRGNGGIDVPDLGPSRHRTWRLFRKPGPERDGGRWDRV